MTPRPKPRCARPTVASTTPSKRVTSTPCPTCGVHDDRVSCTHPGWRTLHGWGAVSGSWFALFGGPQPLQFILTDEHVAVEGDAAWVTVDENLISSEGSGTVAVVNVFVRTGDRWRLVAHHGSAVAPQG